MIREFFNKPRSRLLMIGAILLSFVSQFFYYFDDPDHIGVSDSSLSEITFLQFGQIATGWQLHPQAYVILVVLAFAFLRDEIVEHPLFKWVGWPIAVVLLGWATSPGAPLRAFGAGTGTIALLIAMVATVMHYWAWWRGVGKSTAA